MLPDSTTMLPDSTTMLPDSTTMLPDSTTMLPDSTTMLPDSTTMLEAFVTMLPNSTTTLSDKKIQSLQKELVLSISLRKQHKCMTNKKIQCWDALLIENENEKKESVEIPVFFIMNGECTAFKDKCPRKTEDDAVCFKRLCNKTSPFILKTKNNNSVIINLNKIYFENYEGNYHSSWQHDLSNPLKYKQYEAMEKTQEVIKTLNIYTKFSMNELYLTFTIVKTCVECLVNSNWKGLIEKSSGEIIKSRIRMNKKHYNIGLFLHERLHENINSRLLKKFLINRDSEKLPPVYTGNRTVALVIDDYNSGKFNNSDMIVNINGKVGLVMQDAGHLGNWGVESTPSSYKSIKNNLYIGKYLISVIEEIGFKFSNPIDVVLFEENLKFSSNISIEIQ
jgi:hypothetical protein